MAQQFYKRPNVHRDDDSHSVYDDGAAPQGSSTGQEVSAGAQDRLDDIDKVLADAERGAVDSPSLNSDSSSSSAARLGDMEKNPLGDNSTFKHKEGAAKTNGAPGVGPVRRFVKSKRGKRIMISTGIAGIVTGGSIGLLSILSGPLQFVHLSQILQKAYFSHQEDAGDSRVGRLYRFMRSGGDVGETRLTFLQSKYKNRMLNQFKEAGFTVRFDDKTGYMKSVVVDRESEKSPYHGMSNEEMKDALEKRFGTSAGQFADGKFVLNDKTFWSQRRALNALSKELGYSKVTTAARTRVLSKYGMVTWHPLHKLDKKINTSIVELIKQYRENRDKRIRGGTDATKINTTGATEENDGKQTTIGGTDETATKSSTKAKLESLKSGGVLKVTGGIGAIVGIVCTVRAVNDNLGPIRWEQVILPITRVGMNAITAGDQVAIGNDIDPYELDALSQDFVEKDKSGKVISSWDQAAGIQSITGGSGGVPMDKGTVDMVHNVKPDWIAWTDNAGIGTLCSTAVQAVVGGISIVVSVFSGGVASAAASTLGSMILFPQILDRISALVAGDPANTLATGAAFGNNASLGAFFGANAAALPLGGMQLSAAQTAELNQESNLYDQHEYSQRNMFARMFDPMDYRSFTARMIDSQVLSSPTETVASMMRTAASLPQRIGSMFASTFMNRTAFAATGNTYGIPEVGFSLADLDNSTTDDPYANAEYVAKNALDKNGQSGVADYIGRADKCFGVQIAKDENQKWAVKPIHPVENLYDGSYPADECRGNGDVLWLRVRMFILDSGVMDGMTCLMGEVSSCSNNNGESVGAAPDPTSPTTASASGYAWPLEPDVLKGVTVSYCWFMPSGLRQGHTGVDMPVPVGTKVLAARAGKVVQAGPGGDAGNYIMIKHDDGHWTNYQHLSRIIVNVGDEVRQGELIGLSGDGGYSTSGRPFAHLHFSITIAETLSSRLSGAFTLDPLKLLPPDGPTINCQ